MDPLLLKIIYDVPFCISFFMPYYNVTRMIPKSGNKMFIKPQLYKLNSRLDGCNWKVIIGKCLQGRHG